MTMDNKRCYSLQSTFGLVHSSDLSITCMKFTASLQKASNLLRCHSLINSSLIIFSGLKFRVLPVVLLKISRHNVESSKYFKTVGQLLNSSVLIVLVYPVLPWGFFFKYVLHFYYVCMFLFVWFISADVYRGQKKVPDPWSYRQL